MTDSGKSHNLGDASPNALRAQWELSFSRVLIHAPEASVKKHPFYVAAKSGDVMAALELVLETLNNQVIGDLVDLGGGRNPVLISVHAEEQIGVNAIPEVMADALSMILNWEVEKMVVQANVVNHTGASGFARLARQAFFEGPIDRSRTYIIVDDFVGQGGTIANLRGHIIQQGGSVLGATVLTGKPYSAALALEASQLAELRSKHGRLEEWWKSRFGFGFDCLTASEARYLINTETSDRIRDRIEESDVGSKG